MQIVISLLFVVLGAPSLSQADESSWLIQKDHWSSTDEKNYTDFITALGTSGCNTVSRCMKSPSNPFRNTDPAGVVWRSDCAEFPYFLRAYYAWKNGLPFSYVSGVKPAGSSTDLRYSSDGNIPTDRHDVVTIPGGRAPQGPEVIELMINELNSAMFRIHPRLDSAEYFSNFYSVAINRAAIHAGTMIYDPAGHVVIIYKVEEDGRILYFDAHPDNSVSHSIYGEKFERSRPGQGAGFKNWRPLTLVGAQLTANGLVGGHVEGALNATLRDFSVEQYFGTNPSPDGKWSKGLFYLPNHPDPVDYYDFVRNRLAVGDLKYKPVEEMRNMMVSLCQDLQDRVLAVQIAIAKKIHQAPHPSRLPNNIYGTDGDWETYSTPSRDAVLRTSFGEVFNSTRKYVELYKKHDPRIDYQGADLAQELRAVYQSTAAACNIEYENSAGKTVRLNYDDLVPRLFNLSFDPYHCPELRWGASGAELNSCGDDHDKQAWFSAERRLRNQVERTYSAQMSFDLNDLLGAVPGSGVDHAPDVDLKSYLQAL